MTLKVLYIEDGTPDTIIAELEQQKYELIHHDPETFEAVIEDIRKHSPEVLLLDFRLTDKTAKFDAPTVAQTVRTINSVQHKDVPIVLISTETIISTYYKDYTSQDLFDLVLTKEQLLEDTEKYSARINSIVQSYQAISSVSASSNSLLDLINVPQYLLEKFSFKIKEHLASQKLKESTYLASDFIRNRIVKPIGVLIGEDVLAARLGVDKTSSDWEVIKAELEQLKYTGLFSQTYDRWWSEALNIWWKETFDSNQSLKSLSAFQRVDKLKEKFKLSQLKVAEVSQYSSSDCFWTICILNHTPLATIDGFESNEENDAWLEPSYYSALGASELPNLDRLRTFDRKRFLEFSKGL